MNYKRNEDMFCNDPYKLGGQNNVISTTVVLGSDEERAWPITVDEAKDFCDISRDFEADNDLIETLIATAFELCERETNIGFTQEEREAVLTNPNGGIFLPYGPIEGDITTLTIEDEGQDLDGYTVAGSTWKQIRTPFEIATVRYIGGYLNLPKQLRTAVLNAIMYLYDNRATGADNIGPIAKMILKPISRV